MVRTLCETRRDALEATVVMRVEANGYMVDGMRLTLAGNDEGVGVLIYDEGEALHKYGEQLARLWRS